VQLTPNAGPHNLPGFIGVIAPDQIYEVVISGNVKSLSIDNLITATVEPNSVDVFAMGLGNQWTYTTEAEQSQTATATVSQAITANTPGMIETVLPPSADPIPSSFLLNNTGNILGLSEYAATLLGFNVNLKFTNGGAPFLWYPARLGDAYTGRGSAKVNLGGQTLTISVKPKTQVIGREVIRLPVDPYGEGARLASYHFKTKIGAAGKQYSTESWFVPNLGIASQQSTTLPRATLTNFVLSNVENQQAAITPTSDKDLDGVPDWRELGVLGTNWREDDTDNDGVTDDTDKCPLLNASGDQNDGDLDGVGDSCEVVQEGKVKVGSQIVDKVAAKGDTINAKLTGCEGLADAIAAMPSNISGNVHVTIEGLEDLPAISGADLVPTNGGYAAEFQYAGGTASLGLLVSADSIGLTASDMDVTLATPDSNKPKLQFRVEIGGWTCSSTVHWRVTKTAKLTRFKSLKN
jgi:hypothetical protein